MRHACVLLALFLTACGGGGSPAPSPAADPLPKPAPVEPVPMPKPAPDPLPLFPVTDKPQAENPWMIPPDRSPLWELIGPAPSAKP